MSQRIYTMRQWICRRSLFGSKGERMRLPYRSGKVTLTSPFGWRTLNGAEDYHSGIDLSGTDKTIVAPCDAVVVVSQIVTDKSNLTWQWGNYVCLSTYDGLQIYLCHMSERIAAVGQSVKEGEPIGIEGNTGYSFGSHCHFEIRKDGLSVDPTPYLNIKNEWGQYDVSEKESDMPKDTEIEKIIRENNPEEWAKDSVTWAVQNEIMYGDGMGDLQLKEPCTREQMTVFLHRLYELIRGE